MSEPAPTAKRGSHAASTLALRAALLVVSLAVVEISLRLAFTTELFGRLLWRCGPYGARIAAITGARGHAPVATGREIDSKLGWTNPVGRTVIGDVVMHGSAQRLRGTRTYARVKPPGIRRIEVFGDSFAFGSEVDDDSTYSVMLERALPSAEVLDFGVPGYGLDQALLRFRAEGPPFAPDVVVIGLVSTLLPRDAASFTFWYKPYFVLDGDGQLLLRGSPVPGVVEAARDLDRGSRIVDVLRMLRPVPYQNDDALDRALLSAFVSDVRAAGARPVIVLYPTFMEYAHGSSCANLFRAICAATRAECADTSAAFAEAYARGVDLTAGVHFSAAGHRIVADALAAILAR
jgi:hypothetical protein